MVGKWFAKIPKEFPFSPAGIILFFSIIICEILDLLIPFGSLTIEVFLDLIIAFWLWQIVDLPIQSTILPFLVERIPFLSDILPTWFIWVYGDHIPVLNSIMRFVRSFFKGRA